MLCTALLLGGTGCGSVTAGLSTNEAQVRFVAVAPGTPEVDFALNGTGAAFGLGFESFTSYLPANPGVLSVAASRAGAGAGQALVTTPVNATAGHQYTVVLAHGAAGPQQRVYQDADQPAPPGRIAVRVIDAMQTTGPLAVYVSDGKNATAAPASVLRLSEGEASGYLSLPAGTYALSATVDGSGLRLPVSNVTLRAGAGAVRTVVFAGATGTEGHGHAVGFVLEDVDPA